MAMHFNPQSVRRQLTTVRFRDCLAALPMTISLLILIGIFGCNSKVQFSMLKHGQGTFHQKMGLKAENYFTDAQVLHLCSAIERDDLPEIGELVRAGVDVNALGTHAVTPLFWAFPDNKINRFRLLLELGANPNVPLQSNLGLPNVFKIGDSVLFLAAGSQFPEHFIEVLKHGGDPNLRDGEGNCVIHEIIANGVPDARERIKLAIDHGADINAFDKHGNTSLILSLSTFSQYDLTLWLLNQEADPSIYKVDTLGNAIHSAFGLQRAISDGRIFVSTEQRLKLEEVIQWLRDHGYDVDSAKADSDRWAMLAKKRPGDPGWFIKKEVADRKAREAAEEAQAGQQ